VDNRRRYAEATIVTRENLKEIAQSPTVRNLSHLSLPEIDNVVDLVSQIVPAGNLPGVILSGLARLPGRRLPPEIVKKDVNLLMKTLDRAVYGAFFAGPAAVIWGYQNLLKLAGKDPGDSFPNGPWQFYVEYALREDTARHTSETHGFDTTLQRHQMQLPPVDRITAWVMAAIHTLHHYDDLLKNEWRERTYTHLLREVTQNAPDAARYASLYRHWEKQRPYRRGADVPADTYPAYRQLLFDRFLETAMRPLSTALRRQWVDHVRAAKDADWPAYRQQMTILAHLEPDLYGEKRSPIPLAEAQIALVHQGHYYCLPACAPGSDQPADVETVRAQVAAVLQHRPDVPPVPLADLARIKRAALMDVRTKLGQPFCQALDALRKAPFLINLDQRPRHASLSEIRQAERGVGDHALTLFDTGQTMVFDQSHIFFDGAWGAALSEIMTNEALSWAVYLHTLPPARPAAAISPLHFGLTPDKQQAIQQAPQINREVGVETAAVNLKAILVLRGLFKRRSDLLQLTVNDLLVLYRAIHAVQYRPAPILLAELQALAAPDAPPALAAAAQSALAALDALKQVNPAILIPIDASQRAPRERLYPMSFEVPLQELDLLGVHNQVLQALQDYGKGLGERSETYSKFDELQGVYLATLAGFGTVFSRAREVATRGESVSVASIKLLAYTPSPIQRLLDRIPHRFDILNDLVRGQEVFSNLGAVAPTSSLTRFISAKDDNDKKTLAWGILTDADGVMRITLRDFRPHVALFTAAGRPDVATRLAEDFLVSYAEGLNQYVRDLRRITLASRETYSTEPDR
jgi:hypothetical protein